MRSLTEQYSFLWYNAEEELPYRCIKLYSYPGDLIVDPFCGSGTTCKVSKDNGRHYIGYDIDPGYIEIAKKRLY